MDEQSEQPLQELVLNDKFYQEVLARLGDPNEKDNEGNALLHLAARSAEDNSRIFKLLLEKGAEVNSTTTTDGLTPLHFAVCSRKRCAVVALIEAGASVNSKDFMGRTPLHRASMRRWPRFPNPNLVMDFDMWIVERLLCHPEININPVDNRGETPLMWSVKERHSDAVVTLLKKGANPNIPNNENRTPLHVALLVRNPHQNIVFTLLTNGAGIYCEDIFRKTPIDILIRNINRDGTLRFAMKCVWLITLRYQIRASLKYKLKRFPKLYKQLNKCCKEVRLMTKVVINNKFTLHDFALNCFPERVEDPELTIYTTLVEILLTGLFRKYFELIFDRISRPDLIKVFESTIGKENSENSVPNDIITVFIFDAIRKLYNEKGELKQRLLVLKEILLKKI